jgi:uncharacterized protein (TIGR02448 family)
MKKTLILLSVLLAGMSASAGGISHQTLDATNGNPIVSFTAPTLTSIIISNKWGNMPKLVIVNAYEDAQMHVATNGEVTGPQLAQALNLIHSTSNTQATDIELAAEIITLVQSSLPK